MPRNGKHPHDSGRARYHRFLDRAQLEFDDMLIGDFLRADDDGRDDALAHVPVRYGAARLADLSDSAIAGAMLDAGVFAADEDDDIIPIEAHIGESLFELLEREESPPANVPAARPEDSAEHAPPPVIRPLRVMHTDHDNKDRLSLRGFAQGFLIGAACAGVAVGLYSLVF